MAWTWLRCRYRRKKIKAWQINGKFIENGGGLSLDLRKYWLVKWFKV
jgi:hypothetical protein